MTKTMRSISIALDAIAFGCTSGGRGQAARDPARAAAEPADPAAQASATAPSGETVPGCPIEVPGTELAVADVPAGASITFTTAEPNVEELRARVHEMARMHEGHHGEAATQTGAPPMHPADAHGAVPPAGSTASGGTGSAQPPGHRAMMPPSARALAEEVEGGARIVITADPAEVERLRSVVRAHAAQMRTGGTCEMGIEPPASR